MAIKSVKGHCLTKGKPVGFQFKEATEGANMAYYLAGSFIINKGTSGGEVSSSDLNGSFRYNQDGGYSGCRLCGQKFIYQCCHCNEFICYDGKEKHNVVCPACGKKSDVPATNDKRIVKSGVSAGPIEIILAMDVSYSMLGSRIDETKRAAVEQFVDVFKDNTSMALVLFGVDNYPYVITKCGFTSNMDTIKKAISTLRAEGGTPSPLPHIIKEFPAFMRGNNGANRYVVIFTDGEWASGDHISDANKIKSAGIEILAIGCAGANKDFLNQIASPDASVTGGDGEIQVMFADMARRITQG